MHKTWALRAEVLLMYVTLSEWQAKSCNPEEAMKLKTYGGQVIVNID